MTAEEAVTALERHFGCTLTNEHRTNEGQHRTRYRDWLDRIGAPRRAAVIAALPSAYPPPTRALPTVAALDQLARDDAA